MPRCVVFRQDDLWEWRCPCCSGDYEFGGGSREWWSSMYAVELHVKYWHKPTA